MSPASESLAIPGGALPAPGCRLSQSAGGSHRLPRDHRALSTSRIDWSSRGSRQSTIVPRQSGRCTASPPSSAYAPQCDTPDRIRCVAGVTQAIVSPCAMRRATKARDSPPMPISLPPSPIAMVSQGPARNRSSSNVVSALISSPRMLRAVPSAVRPQRSIATASFTSCARQVAMTSATVAAQRHDIDRAHRSRPLPLGLRRHADAQGASVQIRHAMPTSTAAHAPAEQLPPVHRSPPPAASRPAHRSQ